MSLIQDALRKVQNERNKILKANNPEDHHGADFSDQKSIIQSKKKRYIRLGLILLLITTVSITSVFLLKKPVIIHKNEFLRKNTKVKTKKRIPHLIKHKETPEEILISGRNTGIGLIKKAGSLKTTKDKDIKKTFLNPVIKYVSKKNKAIITKKNLPVFKPKIELVSKKNRNLAKKKKLKIKKISKFENFISKGEKLYKQKKYLEALSYFREALKIKKDKELYLKIYKCYKKTNNLVLLRAYTLAALEQYKYDVFFNKVLGILLFREKDYLRALPYFELILQKMNNNVEILMYKGLCLFHLKKLEDSLAVFKNILKLNINKIESYYYIGLIYDNMKDYKTALDYYRVYEQLFDQLREINTNFRHRNWIRKRISLLERSRKVK